MSETSGPIIFFDGECVLCEGSIRWVLKREKGKIFQYASLQSPFAKKFLEEQGFDAGRLNTLYYWDGQKLHFQSDAILGIASRLPYPWPLARLFRWVPRMIRDGLYAWVARNRYRWFGRRDSCLMPEPGMGNILRELS